MTGPDEVLFGRAEIERAFTALGERLSAGVSSQMYSSWAAPHCRCYACMPTMRC